MQGNVLDIMQNDTLVRELLQDYNYNRSLVDEKFLKDDMTINPNIMEKSDSLADRIGKFFDAVTRFIYDVPSVIWIILGVFLLSLVVYVLFRNGVFSFSEKLKEKPLDTEDNIYEIDYDSEMADAVSNEDYPAVVRLLYLSTLRKLDEGGKIVWRISKTPSQFAAEVNDTAFTQMTHHFLRVRYGRFPATKEMCDEMTQLSSQVLKGGDQ